VTAEDAYKKTTAAPATVMRRFITITRYQPLKPRLRGELQCRSYRRFLARQTMRLSGSDFAGDLHRPHATRGRANAHQEQPRPKRVRIAGSACTEIMVGSILAQQLAWRCRRSQ
jgi:hypothetical protein